MMAFGSSLTPGQTSALRYRVPGTDLDPAEARATGLATGIGGSPTRPVQPAYQQPSSTTGSGRGRRAESVVDKFRKSCSRSVLRSRAPVWFASRVLASGNHVCESVMSWSCCSSVRATNAGIARERVLGLSTVHGPTSMA
jgi:hypothetical protein